MKSSITIMYMFFVACMVFSIFTKRPDSTIYWSCGVMCFGFACIIEAIKDKDNE